VISSLPPVPPVMAQGSSVTYTGQAAADVANLLRLALRVLDDQGRKNGVGVHDRFHLLLHAAELAAADMRTSSDVREAPTSASSEVSRWVGVDEAARLFGVGHRQARRIVREAGGTKTSKGWRINDTDLHAEYELRRSA
jgi:hypothetical protein